MHQRASRSLRVVNIEHHCHRLETCKRILHDDDDEDGAKTICRSMCQPTARAGAEKLIRLDQIIELNLGPQSERASGWSQLWVDTRLRAMAKRRRMNCSGRGGSGIAKSNCLLHQPTNAIGSNVYKPKTLGFYDR